MNKTDAQKAYAENRVRKLYAIEGHEASAHFTDGRRILEALKDAVNIENVFITFDDKSFGVYELIPKK